MPDGKICSGRWSGLAVGRGSVGTSAASRANKGHQSGLPTARDLGPSSKVLTRVAGSHNLESSGEICVSGRRERASLPCSLVVSNGSVELGRSCTSDTLPGHTSREQRQRRLG